MRKKLLRSRTGFEKPESREEAIMQNILGASNVLEPAESNIEEILQAILYNTPYTKEPEPNIEEILLAIKNNGTYTGECESRDMKILYAILNESTYNEESESRIEELFIEWLYQRTSIKVLEGVPPLTFTSRGLPLINYLIEGNGVQNGVGERTENLFDYATMRNGVTGAYLNSDGSQNPQASWNITTYIPCNGTTFTIKLKGEGYNTSICLYDENKTFLTGQKYNGAYTVTISSSTTAKYIRFSIGASWAGNGLMLNEGSTLKPYEPYGYKIPVTCGGVTTDIYIGNSPLYDGDTISMTDTGIEIPTAYGNNVLTVDTTVQPSNVYIEYK